MEGWDQERGGLCIGQARTQALTRHRRSSPLTASDILVVRSQIQSPFCDAQPETGHMTWPPS